VLSVSVLMRLRVALLCRRVLVTAGFVVFLAAALACGKRAEAKRLDAQIEMQSVGMGLRPASMEQQNALQLQQVQQHQVTGHVVAVMNASTNHHAAAEQPPPAGAVRGVVIASDVRLAERTLSP
jgi:hypothetical protein